MRKAEADFEPGILRVAPPYELTNDPIVDLLKGADIVPKRIIELKSIDSELSGGPNLEIGRLCQICLLQIQRSHRHSLMEPT